MINLIEFDLPFLVNRMTSFDLIESAQTYLNKLCLDIPSRQVGSIGNQMATEFFAENAASFGFKIECPEFYCIDWEHGDVKFEAGDKSFEALISPYSLGCNVSTSLSSASSIKELESIRTSDTILLLHGEITKEQLMPKNFPFYNPERHQQIYRILEKKQPQAIVAATSRNPELAGGIYPFPLIEDGDFDIPSVYMTEKEGNKLSPFIGMDASLTIDATRHPSRGCNVIAHKGGGSGQRIVICAHIDAKAGTPGALDNGTGVVILLLLVELMKDYQGELELEIVAINGEDYYAASGEIQYVERMKGRWGEILLAINMDGAGYYQGKMEYSLYECPEEIAKTIRTIFSSQMDFVEGSPWYQSDHSIFIQNGRPAVAITSDNLMELSTNITHTPKDHPELVDVEKLIQIATSLKDVIFALNSSTQAETAENSV
jgi:aminopeptidase YwaD